MRYLMLCIWEYYQLIDLYNRFNSQFLNCCGQSQVAYRRGNIYFPPTVYVSTNFSMPPVKLYIIEIIQNQVNLIFNCDYTKLDKCISYLLFKWSRHTITHFQVSQSSSRVGSCSPPPDGIFVLCLLICIKSVYITAISPFAAMSVENNHSKYSVNRLFFHAFHQYVV